MHGILRTPLPRKKTKQQNLHVEWNMEKKADLPDVEGQPKYLLKSIHFECIVCFFFDNTLFSCTNKPPHQYKYLLGFILFFDKRGLETEKNQLKQQQRKP